MCYIPRIPVQERHGKDEVYWYTPELLDQSLAPDNISNKSNSHGFVCKAEEKICIRTQVPRLEVFVLRGKTVDLKRDREMVVRPQGFHVLHGVGYQLAEQYRSRIRKLENGQPN